MAHSGTLTVLSPREAVADALHRCLLGLDSNDRDLFESACLKEESMTVVATHFITNIRVELKDVANTAFMTAHVVAYHVRPEDAFKPEDTSYTAGALYFIDLVKDDTDGLWKIKKWEIKIQWTSGDKAILHG